MKKKPLVTHIRETSGFLLHTGGLRIILQRILDKRTYRLTFRKGYVSLTNGMTNLPRDPINYTTQATAESVIEEI